MDMLNIIIFLILFPFFLSLACLATRASAVRRAGVVPANLVLVGATLLRLSRTPKDPILFKVEAPIIEFLLPFAEIAVGVLILYLALRSRRYIVALLAGAQLALGLVFEFLFASAAQVSHNLFVDRFSILMALIIGILGTHRQLWVGYMAEYHHHYRRSKTGADSSVFIYLSFRPCSTRLFQQSQVDHFFWRRRPFAPSSSSVPE
jgi:ech hydrogenase subunit A